ncbi:hypothetical protein [Actinophytocola sp. NPDC049390]|uniref:hypothetical protein n=1 Tax=Actinophytocola sp. NPDC049390 TaxID=3363894 RepID=UPI00379232D6
MFSTRKALFTVASAAVLAAGLATPAAAATGAVIAYTHDFTPLAVWEDPSGCTQLPLGTHIIFNETDGPITIYGDPLCLIPLEPMAQVASGYGTHVSAVGSFSA